MANSLAAQTQDDRPRSTARRATVTSRAERDYARQLKLLGRHVGNLVESYVSGIYGLPTLTQLLEAYAKELRPWAVRTGGRMLAEVDARDRDAWRSLGHAISAQLHRDIRNAPIGNRYRDLLAQQVELITSIPTEAAERVHRLATEAKLNGTRAREIAKEIGRTTEVTQSRARLIAHTEVSRASTTFTQARCESIGSTHFIWRTSLDGAVRPDHRKLEGGTFAWDDPPIADSRTGEHALPGCIYACRCWAEPVIDDPYQPEVRGRRAKR